MALFYGRSELRLVQDPAGQLCYKSDMKKFLLGCFLLITACQGTTPVPVKESTSTVTPPPSPEPATATITFTPAPTLSPTPVPLYFTDDFNTPDTVSWATFQTGGATPSSL